MRRPSKTPYEQGQQAYRNRISFFFNPYFETGDQTSITEWKNGWGFEQKLQFAKDHPQVEKT